MVTDRWMIYGATGYTGQLIARAARERGLQPLLAGRDRDRVAALATELDLEWRAIDVNDRAGLAAALGDVQLVLNCAGPYRMTAEPVADAALRTQTQYLDISGEWRSFARLQQLHTAALAAGVMLLPGVGFDVVPSDCLAALAVAARPHALQVAIGLQASGGVSHGTLRSALGIAERDMVRRGGALVALPLGRRIRQFDYGRGPRWSLGVPLADVISMTAWNRQVDVAGYLALPRRLAGLRQWLPLLLPLVPRAARLLERGLARRSGSGPTAEQLLTGSSRVVAEVTDADGVQRTARLELPQAYRFTVDSALAAVSAVLAGVTVTGYTSPAAAFGAEWVLTLPGVALVQAIGA